MVFDEKHRRRLIAIGEAFLGIPPEDLGEDFVQEMDRYVGLLDDFLIKDIKTLISLFGSPIMVFLRTGRFKSFENLSLDQRVRYAKGWGTSKIPLLRTGFTALRSLCGWTYYSNEEHGAEVGHLGKTLGREKETPTLLSKTFYPDSPLAGGETA
ncbi:MAG: hypothetical protein D6732_06155 [Methanobacteriota archaeon]|nr:MAG: hypothetical protein D6732_06155 [Euryarchaeota archaeon]